MLSFFPRDVLDEMWDLIESVSEGFPTYSCSIMVLSHEKCLEEIGILLGKPQPANNIGPIKVPYGILYGSNMGNPYGTDKGFATRFHTGPTWTNQIVHTWEPYGSYSGFGPSGPYQPASVEKISD